MDNNDLNNKIVNRCSICLNIPNIKIYPQNLDLDIDYICHKKKVQSHIINLIICFLKFYCQKQNV